MRKGSRGLTAEERGLTRRPECNGYYNCLSDAAMTDSIFSCTGCEEFISKDEDVLASWREHLQLYKLWQAVFNQQTCQWQ